jgi:flavorubredoxin
MHTRVEEISEGIFQLTTHVDEIDMGFNQYLVTGDEPMLFHTGMRHQFTSVAEAVARVLPVETLRWIAFGHVEADECGAMNHWLAAAPEATVVQGMTGCMVSIGDLADRAPRPLGDGEVLDIGGHRLRWIDTPHLPHGWDAGLLFDESTRTLLCGDLFARYGAYPALTQDDLAAPAIAAERAESYVAWSRVPDSAEMLYRLADLAPRALAPMHAPAFHGDGGASLRALGDDLADLLNRRG